MMRWWDNQVYVKKRTTSEDELLKMRTELIIEADQRLKNESSGKRTFHFRVEAETSRLERVAVTGSCQQLGNWDPGQVAMLDREGTTNIWSKEVLVQLNSSKPIYYRYVVVTDENYADDNPKKNEGGRIKSLRRWEANAKYRKIPPIEVVFQASSSFRKDYLTLPPEKIKEMRREKRKEKRPLEFFGTNKNDTAVSLGWLTTENVLHVKLFRKNLNMFNKEYSDRPIFAKLRAIRVFDSNVAHDDFCEDPDDGWPVVEASILKPESYKFSRQGEYGVRLCGVENVFFLIFHESSENLGLVIDYYVYGKSYATLEPNRDIPLHVAFSVMHPWTMPGSEGEVTSEICSIKGPTIGEIKLKYAFIKYLPLVRYKLNTSLLCEWRKFWGSGSTDSVIKTCSEVRENTLNCVVETGNSKGFSFVEIPLQMTKDGIPVFAHSPYLVVCNKQLTNHRPLEQFQVSLDRFTLHQLQRMRIFPVLDCSSIYKVPGPHGMKRLDQNSHPFPTLMQLLNGIDKKTGFVIEVGTMVCLEDGTYEKYHPHDVNPLLDQILKTIQLSAGKRPIILTSFHPDVCSMLRLKQNLYPVIFLQDGKLDKYPAYDQDVRCSHLDNAIYFAASMGLQGLGINPDTFLAEDNAIKLQQYELVAYVTEDPNDNNSIRYQMTKCKLNGIVCTRWDQYGKIRQPLRYVLEPKLRERCWIAGWADDVAADGYLKPDVQPLEVPGYEITEFYGNLPAHQRPAGVQEFSEPRKTEEPGANEPNRMLPMNNDLVSQIFDGANKL